MANVELSYIRKPCNRPDIFVIEAVSRIHPNAKAVGDDRGLTEPFKLPPFPPSSGKRVSSGVKLNRRCPGLAGCADLTRVRVDKKAHLNPPFREFGDGAPDGLFLSCHIKAPFRGQLTPPFRNQTGLGGPKAAGNAHNLGYHGHLKIEGDPEEPFEPDEVMILNVPPVFTEVGRDAVGARALGLKRGPDRVRNPSFPRLA